MADPSLVLTFDAVPFEWRGPAPFVFVAIPQDDADAVNLLARDVTYGWGMVPVEATIGGTTWRTSMYAKDGGYVLPIRMAVQRQEGVRLGAEVAVIVRISPH